MNSYYEVIRYVNHVQPGQTSNITVQQRGGEEKIVRVTFATREHVYGDPHGQRSPSSGNDRNQDESLERAAPGKTRCQRGRQSYAQQGRNRSQNYGGQDNQGRFGRSANIAKTAGIMAVSRVNAVFWASTW